MFDSSGADQRHRGLIAAARRQFDRARDRGLPIGGSSGITATVNASAQFQLPDLPGLEVLRELHHGGQGIVYRAVQRSTGRPVAVKVLRGGSLAGESERLRFNREVHILAQLNHRNIIGILDRGEVAGVHFLVMDYVDGLPLDRFARQGGLDLEKRLALFADICDAVHAAHLRGVIHRDLKPGNIMIDAAGQPHILDFGLATMPDDAGQVSHGATQTGQFIGSLPWMSPEQARGAHNEVDIRSDVYSLGVILYQLITDRLPYSTVGELEQVLAAIRTAQPISPAMLSNVVDNELETVVLKCLAKEPSRRYQSVGELAQDLRYYLAGEAIVAKRDSAWYVFRRMLRRHTLGVGVAVSFVALTTAAALALAVLYRAKTAEYRRAEEQRAEAVVARDQAEKAAARADAVTDFLRTMLGAADPGAPGQGGHQVKVVDVMKRAGAEASTRFADQPEVEVSVRFALGEAYYGLGLFSEAEAEMRAALNTARVQWGDENDETVSAMMNLSIMLWVQGMLEEGESIARQALDIKLRKYGDLHEESISAMTNLAAILNARGKPEDGIKLNQRALAAAQHVLGFDAERTLELENNLAFSMDKAGRLQEAVILYRRVLEARQALGMAESPNAIITMQSLANCLRALGRLDEAEPLARQVVDLRERILPLGHPGRGDAAQVLGRVLLAREDAQAAADLFRAALDIHQRALPADSWRTAVTRCDLGLALTMLRLFEEAEQLLLEAHVTLSRTVGDHPRQERDTLIGLVKLYEAWDAVEPNTDKSEKVVLWRALLSTTQPATDLPK